MNFKSMTIDDIIKWCQDNHQVAWLKAEAQKEVECKVHPRVSVEKQVIDPKTGKTVMKTVSKVDKTQPYKIVKRPITFVQIKTDFCEAFMPDIMKSKEKKPSMYDRIADLSE